MSTLKNYGKEVRKNLLAEASQRVDEVGAHIANTLSDGFGKGDKAGDELHSILGDFCSMFHSANPGGKDPLHDLDSSERAALAAATRETKGEKTALKAEKAIAQQVQEEPSIELLPGRSMVERAPAKDIEQPER